MRIGIDFGTTHTTAAFFDGEALRFIRLDDQNDDPNLLRSMIYVTQEHDVQLGLEAVQTYLADNTGRVSRFEQKFVGTIENTVSRISRAPTEPDGPITYVQDVWVEEDVGAPGRLLQSVKTALRDPTYEGTTIYGRFYPIQELIALLLTQVRQKAEAELGQPIRDVVLGRPVIFSDDPESDRCAEERLLAAAKAAGFSNISFQKEPIAAARFYTSTVTQSKRVLVFDFGGGTLDLTVMQADGAMQAPTILATQGVLVGGDDFDRAIMQKRVAQEFGTESQIDADGHPFPAHLTARLNQWQTIPNLSKADSMPTIRRAILYGNNKEGFKALETLALKNYGFLLFQSIEQAKRQLSDKQQTTLQLEAEEIDMAIELSRKEFQSFITDYLAEVHQAVRNVVKTAALQPEDIDVLVTTGGSSLIPLFRNMLQRLFPQAELIQSNTFGSVAAGLALEASQTEEGPAFAEPSNPQNELK